jgi:glycine hydroxymethyltransferase
MREAEMQSIGGWITEILTRLGDAETEQRIRRQVAELAARFPIYESRLQASGRAEHARV